MKKANISALLLFLSFICIQLKAQDLILKTSGDTIRCKITEIGTESISYKKASMPTGPTFTDNKTEIVFIKVGKGEIQTFNKTGVSEKSISTSTASGNGSVTQQTSDGKNKIEFLDGQYYINGQKASFKDVNRYLAKSNNPAVAVPLKAAKGTAMAQKIIKITSIPTTIGGSFTSLITAVDAYMLVQRGRVKGNAGAFVKMGLSFVGTAAFPVTAKILKKKKEKMYNRIIDAYNLAN